MPIRRNETGNRLLDRLPNDEYERLVPLLEHVTLAAQQHLYDVDAPIPHVYFPKTGMVSLVTLLKDGRQVESGTIGNEGLVGVSVLLGLDRSTHRVMCQVKSESLRLAVSPFMDVVKRSPQLYALLLRYVAVSLRCTAQIVACNALHPVPERLCRWLLMIHDRVSTDTFFITQEFLAEMLGVRRQTVTVIAGTLQTAGFISYRRGTMRIIKREALEEASCECYEITKSFYDRIMK